MVFLYCKDCIAFYTHTVQSVFDTEFSVSVIRACKLYVLAVNPVQFGDF